VGGLPRPRGKPVRSDPGWVTRLSTRTRRRPRPADRPRAGGYGDGARGLSNERDRRGARREPGHRSDPCEQGDDEAARSRPGPASGPRLRVGPGHRRPMRTLSREEPQALTSRNQDRGVRATIRSRPLKGTFIRLTCGSFKLCYLESERPRTSVTERVLVVLKGPRRQGRRDHPLTPGAGPASAAPPRPSPIRTAPPGPAGGW